MTELDSNLMIQVANSLPEAFPFYHLGSVEPATPETRENAEARAAPTLPSEEELGDCTVIGFRMSGDIQGMVLALFDRGLDLSTYTEMGNLMAAAFVTRLSSEHGLDAMISPPFLLTTLQLSRLRMVLGDKSLLRRSYRHLHPDGRSIPVEILVVPIDSGEGGAGHA